jgi:succinyl-diaminopimelate desuccinylase
MRLAANDQGLIERDAAIGLLAELIALESVNPPGNEAIVAEYLAGILAGLGLAPRIQRIGPGRANVVAVLPGRRAAPGLMLNGHLDVVPPGQGPWSRPPFRAQVADGRVYGRGSADMKAGLAAMVLALARLSRSPVPLAGDVVFAGVADEEHGGLGTQALVDEGELAGIGAVVFGEPTGLQLYIAEKGALCLEVTTQGRAAHAGMPHLGVNAIDVMVDALADLRGFPIDGAAHPLLGDPTLTVGTIRGGTKSNIVPDACTATLDIRSLPGCRHDVLTKRVAETIARRAAADAKTSVRVLADRPGVVTEADAVIVRAAQAALAERHGRPVPPAGTPGYVTDASVLVPATGLPFVVCGPGAPEMAHQTDEFVEIDEYLAAADCYAAMAERYFVASQEASGG